MSAKTVGVTLSSVLDLFDRQREGGERLHKYLDNHNDRRRELDVDVKTIQEVLNRLK